MNGYSLHVEEQQGVEFSPVGDEKGDEHRGDGDEGERDFAPEGSFPQQPDDGGRDDEEVEVARDVPRLEHALRANTKLRLLYNRTQRTFEFNLLLINYSR